MSDSRRYSVFIRRSAENEMGSLGKVVFERLSHAILALESNPHPKTSRKLSGSEEYRIRVGDYRVLYTVDDRKKIVEVVAVGHRRDVYRGR